MMSWPAWNSNIPLPATGNMSADMGNMGPMNMGYMGNLGPMQNTVNMLNMGNMPGMGNMHNIGIMPNMGNMPNPGNDVGPDQWNSVQSAQFQQWAQWQQQYAQWHNQYGDKVSMVHLIKHDPSIT